MSHYLDRLLDVIVVDVHLEWDLARLPSNIGIALETLSILLLVN